ncbi:hypothetical protein LG198_07150 [Methylobacillus arboreus]|uniref:hypothetical protein n=1 Tax=Methylobacillus arboreus TaxID=755170 RepID=UPI001E43E51D|nr:hypothetical protein [Methylobacillus arboreus]MCB5190499.1 hypothetical protein [Methylobacillus arboreus]
MAKITLDLNELGRRLGGWRYKNRTAAEYKAAGSNYRTYKPTVSTPPGGGLQLFTKLDHIRGSAKDDHCQLDMFFDNQGTLVNWRTQVQIQGNPQFDSGLVTEAASIFGQEYGAIANVASKILNSVSNFIGGLGEHGGRAAFPSVIQMNFNHIVECVRREFIVSGAIGAKYAALGGAGGFLGRPLTDELGAPDGIGRYNHFEGGSIYWTSKTGAWSVQGPIRNQWATLGWERSWLGYPISDQGPRTGGGYQSRFQGGYIYWTKAKGAWTQRNLIVSAETIKLSKGVKVDFTKYLETLK